MRRQKTNDRCQMTEDGYQKSDDGGRMTEDRCQMTEDGGQISEDRNNIGIRDVKTPFSYTQRMLPYI